MKQLGGIVKILLLTERTRGGKKRSRKVLKTMLTETGCKPEWVSLEITENKISMNLKNVIDTLTQISEMGIKIAIDDFGTGRTSFSGT